jgi:alkanesulfonate monooxygenase SsuD/methylene tetrahydromethanopterin reductase-like flavin-dependent oxidoreductase (luciferase family)
MKFYFFTPDFNVVKKLDDAGFIGVLFTYNAKQGDFFTRIARNIILDSKIKYMVAIRPYVISPQYLSMIDQSINAISNNRLQINLISGHIKDEESDFGGIVGNVNDRSSSISRSNYLIEYLDSLHSMNAKIPDCYVSVTNKFTFEAAKKHNSKMIIPYSQYISKQYNEYDSKVMISVTPRLRETQDEIDNLHANTVQHRVDMADFTYHQFSELVRDVESNNISKMILSAWSMEETEYIIEFVKQYNQSVKTNTTT